MKTSIKKQIAIALVAIFSIVSLNSCKKDNTSVDRATQIQNNLLNNNWRLSSYMENSIEVILPCEADDTYTFSSGNVVSVDKGTDDCSGNQDSYTETWTLTNDGTKMIYGGETYFVLSSTSSELKLRLDDDEDETILTFIKI